MRAQKVSVPTHEFAAMWETLLKLLHQGNGEFLHTFSWNRNIQRNCDLVAEALGKKCGWAIKGSTIARDYYRQYTKAREQTQESFEISGDFYAALQQLKEILVREAKKGNDLKEQEPISPTSSISTLVHKSYAWPKEAQAQLEAILSLNAGPEDVPKIMDWLGSQKWLKFLLLMGSIIFLAILGAGFFPSNASDSSNHQLILALQPIWILFATGYAFFHLKSSILDETAPLNRGSIGQEKFLGKFLAIWYFWSAIYVILVLTPDFTWATFNLAQWQASGWWTYALLHAANNLTGLYLYLMHKEMSEDTRNRHEQIFFTPIFWGLFVIYTAGEAILLYWGNYWGLDIKNTAILFSLLSGLWAGFATIKFINRLDSKILRVSKSIINFLILYAAIQPLYIFITHPDILGELFSEKNFYRFSLIAIAFAAKMVFLVLVLWLRDTQQLLHYMVRIVTLESDEQRIRSSSIALLKDKGIK